MWAGLVSPVRTRRLGYGCARPHAIFKLPVTFGCTELSREKNWLFLSGVHGLPKEVQDLDEMNELFLVGLHFGDVGSLRGVRSVRSAAAKDRR